MVRLILEEKASNPKKQSKRQKKMAANKEKTCPLCLEPLDLEDINFYPCKCGYQVCRFCWHRIRETENCLCPQCRRQYPEHPVTFKPLTQEQMTQLKNEKKMKEIQKKKEIAENRKQLANIRIVQKNLVYVHGLPQEVETDEELSRKVQQIFREFGAVIKCVINTKTNYVGSQIPRASAYVTYQKMEDALRAYKKLPSFRIEGHEIKTSLGTTKYCSNFLKNVHCPKADCMYLHEMADEELCFTKEQIQTGQHINVGSILYDRMIAQSIQRANQHNQIKEPVIEEHNVEQSENANSEKVNSKEESSESDISEPSHSPQQSRFQHIFTNSESQNSIYGSGFENRFGVQMNSQASDESLRNSVSVREDLTPKSLLSEPSVNNSTIINTKNHQILPSDTRQHFSVEIQQGISSQSNHIHKSFSSSDIDVLNSKNSARFPTLPTPFSSNGTSSSLTEMVEDLKLDDDLGFDPCQLSLDALQKITAEEKNPHNHVPSRNIYTSTVKQPTPYNSFVMQTLKNLQQPQNFMPRVRNPPPPGFAANAFSSSQQPLASPGYEPRNVTSNRMSPVINLSNFNSIIRPNFPFQRYQSMSNNSVANGFTPQQIRTVPPAQTFHDFPSRSVPTSQHMPSQRLENMPILPQQHFTSQEQNLSPSFMNMNQQTQWMPTYENFQSPNLSKYRPASPQNFPVAQQFRPEEIQRLQYPRLNLSPFTDNSQYGFSANQNQIKGVNTFP
ncbi:CCR4-NOT transcription complex subunit 4-like [Argiope bruennichi]|uniref:CCR4-NOT transcription complex subunit 4 like protein n=1 Tax=Argiope bruennichi TaxID=94029 RepID=A0A8T0EQQ6_ARGBR|nr:CCR4-NOT transcription complex subunit 4-like [Argiope bruennichi]KAF8778243.1 CCR4-NOT transcription complex subunit 4 like protein [Argiope bruennichi]